MVSGVACVLPELTGALFAEPTESERFAQLDALLADFRSWLGRFPVPWGLKFIAESRGICTANFAQPITELRKRQSQEFISWFREWEAPALAIAAQPSAAAAKT